MFINRCTYGCLWTNVHVNSETYAWDTLTKAVNKDDATLILVNWTQLTFYAGIDFAFYAESAS